ncbi:unnamed protein product, partial [Phaeothamnion confervicola]
RTALKAPVLWTPTLVRTVEAWNAATYEGYVQTRPGQEPEQQPAEKRKKVVANTLNALNRQLNKGSGGGCGGGGLTAAERAAFLGLRGEWLRRLAWCRGAAGDIDGARKEEAAAYDAMAASVSATLDARPADRGDGVLRLARFCDALATSTGIGSDGSGGSSGAGGNGGGIAGGVGGGCGSGSGGDSFPGGGLSGDGGSGLPSRKLGPDALAVEAVCRYLEALAAGHPDATDVIPRVLHLVGAWPAVRETFRRGSMAVPAWRFLRWTSQLVALLARPERGAVLPLLERMAREFPRALFFPLKVSRPALVAAAGMGANAEGSGGGGDGGAAAAVRAADRLAALASDPAIEALAVALRGLHYPEMRFLEGMKAVHSLLLATATPTGGPGSGGRGSAGCGGGAVVAAAARSEEAAALAAARRRYLRVREECLVETWPFVGEKIGEYNRKFARQWGAHLDRRVGADASRMTADDVVYMIGKAQLEVARLCAGQDRYEERPKLDKFSTWMSDYDAGDHPLEVPGQYRGGGSGYGGSGCGCRYNAGGSGYDNGDRGLGGCGGGLGGGDGSGGAPRPDYHARVVSFGKELLVMQSLRKPKRLVIHGNDEREYWFLLKGGEDLRLDERVQQLFGCMNAAFAADAACQQARLSLRTYEVVPVADDLGVIEWVPDTVPLKAVVDGQLVKDAARRRAEEAYTKWIMEGAGRDGNMTKGYHAMFQKASREQVTAVFGRICADVPADCLRRHLAAMAPAPEAFLMVRAAFARSLAAFDLCSYLLGIGDRHLDNFLLDTTRGAVVGIDFGVAFGLATAALPVPELLPFRMTQQFQGVLQPLDSVGLMERHMISALHALRERREVLINTMDVFINEVRRDGCDAGDGNDGGTSSSGSGSSGSGACGEPAGPSLTVEAARKIVNARKKFAGFNPVGMFVDDLENNPNVRRYKSLAALRAIAAGSIAAGRARAAPEHADGPLLVATQVRCLMDMATDPDVLGRQWVGLAMWL